MKISNPKMILNLSLENEELEEKVKLAMNEYTEKLILRNLDTYIAKVVESRLEYLIKGYTKIDGKNLNTFINEKCSETIEDVISKNIKNLCKEGCRIIIEETNGNRNNQYKGEEL